MIAKEILNSKNLFLLKAKKTENYNSKKALVYFYVFYDIITYTVEVVYVANWYKLDNAAKLFPFIYSKKDTNSFRLSCVFVDDIIVENLKPALKTALHRFPTFCVKLKRGLFWNYFDHNSAEPIIKEENPCLGLSIHLRKNHGFMFTLSYYGKRLILEVFHSLSDGTGALEFFKCICYYYLLECGVSIDNHGEILSEEFEKLASEKEDCFNWNYDPSIRPYPSEPRAYRLRGHLYPDVFTGIIHVATPVDKILEVAHRYQATLTEYISGCVLKSIYDLYYSHDPKAKRPAVLFLPVNARRFFESQSVRNFVLYVRIRTNYQDKPVTLEQMIKLVKETLKEELTKEKLSMRIVSNVRFEKNFLIRILPLFLKTIGMKIGYHVAGQDANTISFSNLGVVHIPEDMKPYITRFEFLIAASNDLPYNMAGISYNGQFVLSFSARFMERYFIRHIVDQLVQDGLPVEIETNDLEVE